jgi:hypothetical protein
MKKLLGLLMIVGLMSVKVVAHAASVENWVSLSVVGLPTQITLGDTYSSVELKVTNPNASPFLLNTLLNPSYPAGFTVSSDTCKNITLAPNASCYVTGSFTPTAFENIWSTQVVVENIGWQEVYSTTVLASDALTMNPGLSSTKLISFNGDTDSGTLTISNTSSQNLSLSAAIAVPISGLTLYSSNCTDSIAPGASCSYGLSYTSPTNPSDTSRVNQVAHVVMTYGTSSSTATLTYPVGLVALKKGAFISLPSFKKGSSLATDYITDIVVRHNGLDWYVATNGGLSISHDGGLSFRTDTMNDGLVTNAINAVAVSDDGEIIATASNEGLSVSTNGGLTFTAKDLAQEGDVDYVSDVAIAGHTIYAVLYNTSVKVSSDQGQTFQSLAGVASPYHISLNEQGNVVAITRTDDELDISSDGGQSFLQIHPDTLGIPSFTSLAFSSIAMSSDGSVIDVLNSASQLIQSNDTGGHFSLIATPDQLTINNVSLSSSGHDIFLSTPDGVAVSIDAGASFVLKPIDNGYSSNSVNNVTYDDATDTIYAATEYGLNILKSGEQTFINHLTTQGLAMGYLNTFIFDKNHSKLFAASSSSGLQVSSDDGNTFSSVPGFLDDEYIYRFAQSSDGQTIYAASVTGTFLQWTRGIRVSEDGGQTFSAPVTLCDENNAFVRSMYVNPVSGKVYLLLVDASGGFDMVLAITDRSLNNAQCFSPTNSTLPSGLITSVVATADDQTIYLGGYDFDGLGVLTNNATSFVALPTGLSPSPSSTITFLHRDAHDQHIYAASQSGLAVSADEGNHFSIFTQSSGLPEDEVNYVTSFDNGTSWLVSTDLGLSITRDNGQSFTNYSQADGLIGFVKESYLTNDQSAAYVKSDYGLFYTKFAN